MLRRPATEVTFLYLRVTVPTVCPGQVHDDVVQGGVWGRLAQISARRPQFTWQVCYGRHQRSTGHLKRRGRSYSGALRGASGLHWTGRAWLDQQRTRIERSKDCAAAETAVREFLYLVARNLDSGKRTILKTTGEMPAHGRCLPDVRGRRRVEHTADWPTGIRTG